MNQEALETYALAAIGAAEGIFNYYVKPELTAKRTWATIGVIVAAHELLCPPGQLLSEGADNAIERHPYITKAVIGLTALHLANALPPSIDPIHQSLKLLKRL